MHTNGPEQNETGVERGEEVGGIGGWAECRRWQAGGEGENIEQKRIEGKGSSKIKHRGRKGFVQRDTRRIK